VPLINMSVTFLLIGLKPVFMLKREHECNKTHCIYSTWEIN